MPPEAAFDPPVFRFTVCTVGARNDAIKAAAAAKRLHPNQLMQALFDRLDLDAGSVDMADAINMCKAIWPPDETAKQLQDRAAAAGLTVKELKVLRALAECLDTRGYVQPVPKDIGTKAMVPADEHRAIYDRLLVKGFIKHAGKRFRKLTFTLIRLPG